MASAALRPGLRITAPMRVDKVVLNGKWAKRDGGTPAGGGGRSTNRGLAVVLCVLQVADGDRGLGGLSAQSTPMHALTLSLPSDIVSDLLRLGICADSARSTKLRLRPAAQLSGVLTSGISLASACRRSSKIRDVGSVGRRLEPRLEPRRGARQRPKGMLFIRL